MANLMISVDAEVSAGVTVKVKQFESHLVVDAFYQTAYTVDLSES